MRTASHRSPAPIGLVFAAIAACADGGQLSAVSAAGSSGGHRSVDAGALNATVCEPGCGPTEHCELRLQGCENQRCAWRPVCSNRLVDPCAIVQCPEICAVDENGSHVCVSMH